MPETNHDDPRIAPAGRAKVALLRRRRAARTASVLIVVGAVAALMVYAAAEDNSPQPASAPAGRNRPPTAGPPCPRVEAPEVSPPQYDQAPVLDLEAGVDYKAVIETSCGRLAMDLLEDRAPQTVANFIFLAQEGFFDGLTWHRVERDFVVQTGDPDGLNGHSPDGPGYTIPDELPAGPGDYTYGVVAMANNGPATGGSQFFIVVHDPVDREEPAGTDSLYSIFGRVLRSSYATLDKIATMPVKGGGDVITATQPRFPVIIESVGIRRSR